MSLEKTNGNEILYAGFWKRFCAMFLDILILCPILGLSFWIQSTYRFGYIYLVVPNIAFNFWYYVILVKKYGGTPGKRLVGVAIQKIDGGAVDIATAFKRHSVEFTFAILISISFTIAILRITDDQFYSLNWVDRSMELAKNTPTGLSPIHWLNQIWVWSEIFVLLTNKRKRALHDFIAGTIVVEEVKPQTIDSKL